MKKIFTLLAAVLMIAAISAQIPDKMSYQAVIRDTEGNLVTEQEIGMQISILQGSADGTVVYTETQTPATNKNGLVSIEIGVGSGFADIGWSDGPYFLKTETDPEGGTDYTITGTNQLLSVPYALHSGTSDVLKGEITESQISDLQDYLTEETDPAFTTNFDFTDVTENNLLRFDGTKWIQFSPDYLTGEDDPVFNESAASDIEEDDIDNWDEVHGWGDHSAEGYLTDYTETDPTFTATFSITDPADGDLLRYNDVTDKWEKYTPDYAAGTHAHAIATDEADGFMSAADKEKLDGLGGSLSLGESHQGGIIFWLDASGEHGLIAAPADQSEGINWHNGLYTSTKAFASAVGAGYGNTGRIVYNQGTGDYAARLCHDLSLGGYEDWYLPSKYELNLMYQNIGQGNLLGLGNVGGFASANYWSSTEYANNIAWLQNFTYGYQSGYYKSSAYRVRAVRAF